jgi:hypothetical protein
MDLAQKTGVRFGNIGWIGQRRFDQQVNITAFAVFVGARTNKRKRVP